MGTERRDKRGRRIGDNWWRNHIVDMWFGMDEDWRAAREEVCMGYKSEEAKYARDHPRPTLKKIMIQCAFKHLAEEYENG